MFYSIYVRFDFNSCTYLCHLCWLNCRWLNRSKYQQLNWNIRICKGNGLIRLVDLIVINEFRKLILSDSFVLRWSYCPEETTFAVASYFSENSIGRFSIEVNHSEWKLLVHLSKKFGIMFMQYHLITSKRYRTAVAGVVDYCTSQKVCFPAE